MDMKEIIKDICKKKENKIKQVYFIACGGSFSSMYPAVYFLKSEAKNIRAEHYTSNEFVHATPKALGKESVAILCSHGGNTPETVEAARVCKEAGASTITLTYTEKSPITEHADYVVKYEFGEDSNVVRQKTSYPLIAAIELLNQIEGYKYYDKAIDGFKKIDGIAKKAVSYSEKRAEKFADEYKSEKLIYLMGSGSSFGEVYGFSICLLMEMQWVNSSAIHSGEYFHGPFEITDRETPFMMVMSEGRTRALDQRALDFLKRYGEKITVIDAKELGLNCIDDSVVEFFNPLLFVNVLRVYAEKLADRRQHPLSQRRYMWKLKY